MRTTFRSAPRAGAVICGAYGMENAGDDAVLSAIVTALRRIDGSMPITVLARRPKSVAARFSVGAIHPLRLLRWMATMRRARLFISGGGSLLQDITSRRSLWYYLLTIRLAKRLGCAVQLYGCGIGPLRSPRSREATARILNACADIVTLRDKDSAALLDTLGVTKPRILLAADPALGQSPTALREREPCLGIALRDWPGLWTHIPELAAAIRRACDTYKLAPVFFCFAPEDRQAVRSVCAELSDLPCSVSVEPRRIGRMSLVLSMRLHGLVFALRDGAPAAGVSYDPKVDAFCREAGLPCLPLAEVTADALSHRLDEAIHLDTEQLSAAAEALARRADISAGAAAQLYAEGAPNDQKSDEA